MDIFERQEMRKNRPQVTSKLNDWHDWLVNHVPKTIKDNASRAFRTFKDKVMGLFKGTNTGDELNLTQLKPPAERPPNDPKKLKRMKIKLDKLNKKIRHSKKRNDGLIHKRNSLRKAIEEFKRGSRAPRQPPHEQGFIERERAFGGAYRGYRVNGRSRMDVDTFFSRIRRDLISLINRELTDLNSARVQTTTWIRFIQEYEGVVEIDRVEMAFNSRMTEVHQGSDLDEIVDAMIAHMKTQIENPALVNIRFRFDEALFLDVNFHRLNLTRGSSYISLPDWIAKKKAIINPASE